MSFVPYEQSVVMVEKSFTCTPKKERVALLDSLGRILAEDIIASFSQPKYPTSQMDGYAIRFEDQESGVLTLTHSLPAGSTPSVCVGQGECIKTFTGSQLSCGADTIIPIENVEVVGDKVHVKQKVPFGFSVREVGEEYKEGELLLRKGECITYAHIGVLGSLGILHVYVAKKPVVAVLSTGSEIVDIGEELTNDAQIRSSNHITLASLVKQNGCEAIILGIVKDDKELIRQKILEGLERADILITTGGVSVGDFDFVKEIVSDFELVLGGALTKPGRHVKVAKCDEKYIFALPGFPYSSVVTFGLYGFRLIDKMLGLDYQRRFIDAILEHDVVKKSPYFEFVASGLSFCGGKVFVSSKKKKSGSSAILNNWLDDAVLMCVPLETKELKAGEVVKVLRLCV